MTTDTLEKPKVVPQSLYRGWSHPAVQRLRNSLTKSSDADVLLLSDLEDVLLNGAWMSTCLPVPFTKESPEGVRLQMVLERSKKRHPNRCAVQDFVFKFWNPDVLDEAALMLGGGLDFETAFAQSQAAAYARGFGLDPRNRNEAEQAAARMESVHQWPKGW